MSALNERSEVSSVPAIPAAQPREPPDDCEEDLVRPALRYARSSDSLLAMPVPAHLSPNRPWYYRIFHTSHYPLPLMTFLTCLSILANALVANGVYAWPAYGPVIIERTRLGLAQGQSIVVGGVLGLYLTAALMGNLCDKKGPRLASLISAIISFVGYQSFAFVLQDPARIPWIRSDYPENPINNAALSATLAVCYAFVGSAGVGSYFGALTTSSLSFPKYPTLALGIPLSCIGLSSLSLASIGRLDTMQSHGDLNPVKFLSFLGILVPLANLFSSLFMNVLPSDSLQLTSPKEQADTSVSDVLSPCSPFATTGQREETPAKRRLSYPDDPSHLLNPTEHTPLLIGGPEALYSAAREEEEVAAREDPEQALKDDEDPLFPHVHHHWTAKKLLRDAGFWGFGITIVLAVGPGEMTLSSIGSILTSILNGPKKHRGHLQVMLSVLETGPSPLELRSKHILYLSTSSTLARLVTGVTADYLAPIAAGSKTIISRSTYTAGCLVVATAVYLFTAFMVDGEESLWVLSIGMGAVYGSLFTLIPAIVSRHYGPAHFGLSWGMLSYFSALGSAIFGYLYALLAEYVARQQGRDHDGNGQETDPTGCRGVECFRSTYLVSAVCGILAVVGMLIVGRRWKV